MNLEYRRAIKLDQRAICEFQIAMAMETEGLQLDAGVCMLGVGAVFDRTGLGQYFVCEEGSEIVASLMITHEWSDWRNGTVWWIQSVYVKPTHRRRGVFKGLYRFVQGQMQWDASIRGLRLYVERTNQSAQRVYSTLGMNGDHYRLFEWMKSY